VAPSPVAARRDPALADRPSQAIVRPLMKGRAVSRRGIALMGLVGLLAARTTSGVTLPGTASPATRVPTEVEAAIEAQPICIGSTVHSFGRLGDVVYYRAAPRADGRLDVGYYVFYSEERPWGNNWLTWSILPALAIDLVYTRALFVAPGAQRALYGKGDVEGFRVVYEAAPGSPLSADEVDTDDTYHRAKRIGRADLFAFDPGRLTVFAEGWNHHLGTKAAQAGDVVSLRCYESTAIRPLTAEIAREFHLERRARPAAVGQQQGS
jgi:hypothetical protein